MNTSRINTLKNILCMTLFSSIFFSLPASAATTMRCNNKIVDANDSMGSIVAKCGEPSSVQRFTEPARYRDLAINRSSVDTEITEWVYNFGSNKLMMQLRFSHGQLQEVRSLGYGH